MQLLGWGPLRTVPYGHELQPLGPGALQVLHDGSQTMLCDMHELGDAPESLNPTGHAVHSFDDGPVHEEQEVWHVNVTHEDGALAASFAIGLHVKH